jgi:hypothetical protein
VYDDAEERHLTTRIVCAKMLALKIEIVDAVDTAMIGPSHEIITIVNDEVDASVWNLKVARKRTLHTTNLPRTRATS